MSCKEITDVVEQLERDLADFQQALAEARTDDWDGHWIAVDRLIGKIDGVQLALSYLREL